MSVQPVKPFVRSKVLAAPEAPATPAALPAALQAVEIMPQLPSSIITRAATMTPFASKLLDLLARQAQAGVSPIVQSWGKPGGRRSSVIMGLAKVAIGKLYLNVQGVEVLDIAEDGTVVYGGPIRRLMPTYLADQLADLVGHVIALSYLGMKKGPQAAGEYHNFGIQMLSDLATQAGGDLTPTDSVQ